MLNNELNSLRAAVGFLTLLPVLGKKKLSEQDFAGAIKYFSLAGCIFSLLNLLLLFLFKNFFFDKVFLFAILFIFIDVFLSGALHIDGLMDSFDGIAAAKSTRAETLKVMKDSRVGAFGALAAVLVIIAKFVFLSEINYEQNFLLLAYLLFILPIMSRFMMVLVICFQVEESKVSDEGNSLILFKQNSNNLLTILINIITAKIVAWSFILVFKIPLKELLFCNLLILPWMLITWLTSAWLKFKLKGHSGDSMGAGLVISETLYLLLLVFV